MGCITKAVVSIVQKVNTGSEEVLATRVPKSTSSNRKTGGRASFIEVVEVAVVVVDAVALCFDGHHLRSN
jgi:hypothetical protein